MKASTLYLLEALPAIELIALYFNQALGFNIFFAVKCSAQTLIDKGFYNYALNAKHSYYY